MFEDHQLYRIWSVGADGVSSVGQWCPVRGDAVEFWRKAWPSFNANIYKVEVKDGKVLTEQRVGQLTIFDKGEIKHVPFIAIEVPGRVTFRKA